MVTFVDLIKILKPIKTRQFPMAAQYLLSLGIVVFVALLCYFASPFLGYQTVALLLLMAVSVMAMLFEILPVLLACILSALIWNFVFIPPVFTFHIEKTEDVLMFLLYFVIALVNAVLSFKIRDAESKARDKEEKEKTIQLYDTLLNSLSHELRTPIATIIGSVDAIKENQSNLSEANRSELLDEIQEAGLRLNREVENLLSMSRLESGMLKPRHDWCDMNELIHSVLQKMPQGTEDRLVYENDEDLPIFKLDAGLLEQVLYNIIYNGIVHTPDKTKIHIFVANGQEECRIVITDDGPGFPESQIAFAFDKFYRLPQNSTGGSGLGLSIAKGFVEAMGGTILLDNNPEGGARFTIVLPCGVSFLNHLKNE